MKAKFGLGISLALLWGHLVFSEVAKVEKTAHRYLGTNIYFSQSVGAGNFISNMDSNKTAKSWLSLYPKIKSKKFWGNRQILAHVEFGFEYDWMAKEQNNKSSFADAKFRLKLLNAFNYDPIGFKFTPGLKIEIPTTKSSVHANKIIGIGTNLRLGIKKWGLFLTYKPTIIGYLYSTPYKTQSCTADSATEDRLVGGQCKKSGRQTLAMFKNGVYLGYAKGDHTLMFGFKTYHGLLRAPSKESGGMGSTQKFTEATLGFVEYTYDLPIDIPLSLSLGMASYNGAYDPANGFIMPFFSSHKNAKSISTVYAAAYLVL